MTAMSRHGDLPLAIRTVVVTTRVAVESQRRIADEDGAREALERGLALMDDLDASHVNDGGEARDGLIATARRELESLV